MNRSRNVDLALDIVLLSLKVWFVLFPVCYGLVHELCSLLTVSSLVQPLMDMLPLLVGLLQQTDS